MATTPKPIALLLGNIEHAQNEWSALSVLAELRVSGSRENTDMVPGISLMPGMIYIQNSVGPSSSDCRRYSKSAKEQGNNS